MSKQQCEICGQMKSQQEMSKSYKHRCKECVARLTRIDRQAAKQRAEHISQQQEGTDYILVCRREDRLKVATAAMQGILSNPAIYTESLTIQEVRDLAQVSLAVADALLAKIDEKGETQ